MDVVSSSSVYQLLETARQICSPEDTLARRAAGCMYGLSARYSEFAVDMFEPAIFPKQRYCGRIAAG